MKEILIIIRTNTDVETGEPVPGYFVDYNDPLKPVSQELDENSELLCSDSCGTNQEVCLLVERLLSEWCMLKSQESERL